MNVDFSGVCALKVNFPFCSFARNSISQKHQIRPKFQWKLANKLNSKFLIETRKRTKNSGKIKKIEIMSQEVHHFNNRRARLLS